MTIDVDRIETELQTHAKTGAFADMRTRKVSLISRIDSLNIQIKQLQEELEGIKDDYSIAREELTKLLQVFPAWDSEKVQKWLSTAYPAPNGKRVRSADAEASTTRVRRTNAELAEIDDKIWGCLLPDEGRTSKELATQLDLDLQETKQSLTRLVRKEVAQCSGEGRSAVYCRV
jgi:hypothetical protein